MDTITPDQIHLKILIKNNLKQIRILSHITNTHQKIQKWK